MLAGRQLDQKAAMANSVAPLSASVAFRGNGAMLPLTPAARPFLRTDAARRAITDKI